MNDSFLKVPKAWLFLISVFLVGTYAFFAVEARDEIYYLCGNFKEGVSYSSVVRQLDTSNLSVYEVVDSETGQRVVHSSVLHWHSLRCKIDIDSDEQLVVSTAYEWQ